MISPLRFDGSAVWLTLTAEQQDAIGSAALEMVAARFAIEEGFSQGFPPFGNEPPLHRAGVEAERRADHALCEAFVAAVDKGEMLDGNEGVKLPSAIGMVCLECGCSENDACADGCAWAEPDLCTACRDKRSPESEGNAA